ncbi:unnamed protein product [Caenorhabditis brenneri]
MGVPILRLPVIALKVLLDYMNNVEIVTVSLLSRRADWFLKACGKQNVSFFNLPDYEIRSGFRILALFLLERRRQGKIPEWNFELRCFVVLNLSISIRCRKFTIEVYFENLEDIEKFEGTRRSLKMGGSLVPVVIENGIRTFWNSKADGMIVLMDYFKTDSNLSIERLELSGWDEEAIRTIVNHINSSQAVVKSVLVKCYPTLSEQVFKFILENILATESFSSYLSSSWNFQIDGTLRAKNIEVRFGRWYTLDNLLMSTESEKIYVHGSNYTEEELRRFLREWESGKFPKLKEVKLATKVSYLDVTRRFEKRPDKCSEKWGHPLEAFRGHGDFYFTVDPSESKHGYFHMRVHND